MHRRIDIRRKKLQLWRGTHSRLESGARIIPYKMPSVIPPIEQNALPMTEAIQRMSFALMQFKNPLVTPQIWHAVHKCGLCLNNEPNDGFDCGIPLQDFITQSNLDSPYLPQYDKAQRTFQGTAITAEDGGDVLICRPGVHGIDANQLPYPSPAEIVARHWYVIAVNCGPENNLSNISHFAQGQGGMIVYPFILAKTVTFEKRFFREWTAPTDPDPLIPYN